MLQSKKIRIMRVNFIMWQMRRASIPYAMRFALESRGSFETAVRARVSVRMRCGACVNRKMLEPVFR